MSITFTSLGYGPHKPAEIFLAKSDSNPRDVLVGERSNGIYKSACTCCDEELKWPGLLIMKECRPEFAEVRLFEGALLRGWEQIWGKFDPMPGGEIEEFLLTEHVRFEALIRERGIRDLSAKVQKVLSLSICDKEGRREALTRLLKELDEASASQG